MPNFLLWYLYMELNNHMYWTVRIKKKRENSHFPDYPMVVGGVTISNCFKCLKVGIKPSMIQVGAQTMKYRYITIYFYEKGSVVFYCYWRDIVDMSFLPSTYWRWNLYSYLQWLFFYLQCYDLKSFWLCDH